MNRAKSSKISSENGNEELKLLYDEAPCGYHSLDAQGRIIRVNNTELTMLGYQREEMLGQHLTQFLTEKSIAKFKKNFPKVKRGKPLNDEEFEFICKDGSILDMSITVKPVLDPSGKFLHSHTALINISDRKKLEREGQKSELALEITKTGTWEWNLVNNLQSWNPSNYTLLGYQPWEKEASYEIWRCRVHPEDLTEVEQKITQALATHSEYKAEYRVIWEDGTIHWLQGQGRGIYDEKGQALRMVGTLLEITEGKIAELNLQFLNDLDLRLRQLQHSDEMLSEAIKSIGEYLQVDRVAWHNVNVAEDLILITHHWRREANIPTVTGSYPLSEFILPELIELFTAGEPAIVSDVATYPYTAPFADNFAKIDILAFVTIPCISEGKWVAVLSINAQTPRTWPASQVILLQDVVKRLWSIIAEAKALQALQEKEQQMRLALTGAKAGAWNWDLLNKKLLWSPETFNIYGLEPSAQQPSYEIWYETSLHPEDRLWVNSFVSRAIEQRQEDFQLEFRIIHPQKGLRWIFSLGHLRFNGEGEAVSINGINLDITERKEAKIALQGQIEREKLVNNIAQSIRQSLDLEEVLQSTVNQVGGLLKCDRVVIFRFQPDWTGTVITESVINDYPAILGTEIYDPCFAEKYIEPYRQGKITIRNNFLADEIEPCYQKLMQPFEVKANLVIPLLPNDQLWGLLIAHQCSAPRQWQDEEIELLKQLSTQISIAIQQAELFAQTQQQLLELQKAQQALLASEEKLQAILDYAPVIIYVIDLDNKHLLVNKNYAQLLATTETQLLGKSIYEFWDKETADRFALNNHQVIESKQILEIEENVPHIDGSHTYITLKFPLYDGQGNIYAVGGISTDITEKKQLEKQFYQAQRLESLGTLASGIAHDLNNVFTPILATTQLLPLKLKHIKLDEKTKRLLQITEDSVRRGANLVKQILTFARGTTGEKNFLEIDILLKEIVKIAQQTLPKSINISLEIADHREFFVKADPTQLDQTLMNLLINARDAMPQGGKIKIYLQKQLIDSIYLALNMQPIIGNYQEGNYILITVSDTGSGIESNIIDQIFEPFFTTKEIGKGTGLGLATVLGIVQDHSGFLQVLSEVGKGTTFKIYLPEISDKEIFEDGEETTVKILLQGKGETILVVDDEPLVREMTKIALDNHNYETMIATDGIEAIAIYAQYQPEISLVIMNMIMPNIDGLTAIRTLLKINPDVKIIACSGLETQRQIALEAGAKVFLVKPYTTEDLLKTVFDLVID